MATTEMTVEQAQAALTKVSAAMHAQFPTNSARLAQFDDHLATAGMAVEHLFDEKARADHDRAERIRRAEQGE